MPEDNTNQGGPPQKPSGLPSGSKNAPREVQLDLPLSDTSSEKPASTFPDRPEKMSSFFEKLQQKAASQGIKAMTRNSWQWYYNQVKNIRNLNRVKLLNDSMLSRKKEPIVGRMFMFIYDPKFKEELPYYDKFPLILMVGPAKGGFYGLNLHYLPPQLRALFFDRLLEYSTNKRYDASTKIALSYELLKASGELSMFSPCFKHYLYSQVRTPLAEVYASEWEAALYLPTDDFVYKNRQTIWNYARKRFA